MELKYPVYLPNLSGNERKYLNECIDTGWLTENGKFGGLFEDEFKKFTSCKYATTVANGTLALHLALVALGIGPGDEVILPSFTYIATANAVVYTGATPVFVDSEPDFWQIDPNDIRKKITPNTKVIIPVHLYGHPCEMDQIMAIAKEHDIFVVEDAAEGFGTKYKGQHVGTFGDIGIFSFYGNKTITTGEGGMLITNDKTIYNRAWRYKGQGLAKWRQYWHDIVGNNYRMTNMCAAIGLAQMERAEETIAKKRKLAEWYKEHLKDAPVVAQPESSDAFHSYWMYTILVEESELRDPLREHLNKNGIDTRPTFFPVHTMPMYSEKYQKCRVAENIAWRGMNLPSYPDLKENDIIYITDKIKSFFK
jgi:perosamine synthetase